MVKKYAHLAQLEDVTPHTLHHTFAKRVLEGGAPAVTVARLLAGKIGLRRLSGGVVGDVLGYVVPVAPKHELSDLAGSQNPSAVG